MMKWRNLMHKTIKQITATSRLGNDSLRHSTSVTGVWIMSWFQSNLVSTGPLRSARSYVPSDGGIGDANSMMTDLVLSDIQKAINEFEKKKEDERQRTLKELRQPDYSWLMDWKLKAKRTLSFKESSEIETLCSKLKPCEWKEVITAWRSKTVNSQSRDEIVEAFKESATEIINKRIERELEMIRESDEPPQQLNSDRSRSVAELSVLNLTFPGLFSSNTDIRRYNEPSDVV
ncbi:hypothetical protein FO519_000374 [Halicephalobus sp. NKZ332]|nr:hypothetical protein FO519_000374 [Halicephalobus sp. NKZ332]